jgi:cell filamentation protein
MNSLDRLPPDLRYVVGQSVAAQRLEGWRPTAEQLDDLVELGCGEKSFAEYLGEYARRHLPSPPNRRVLGRKRPYLIPGTTTLRNNFGTASAAVLAELEFVAAAGRTMQWHQRLVVRVGIDDLDPCHIHRHIFADVYAWAGELRVTELRYGAVAFARRADLALAVQQLRIRARALPDSMESHETELLAIEFARWYADYNQVHPFRDGNGRTGTLLLHTLAALCGYRLDLAGVTRAEWYAASGDSMPFRRGGIASHRPFLPIFLRALRR